ncbi:unnamed protein product [Oikopleura dioica]|uniref:RING-type domain-containing protein n=1 Tax=Oikopleura dioica TaxID=34765 RepID=E4Y910_OIKDI|nr:unnamed protein product [Oikopleura dioica]
MKRPETHVSLDKFVVSNGDRGQCFGCKNFYYETAVVSSKAYCRKCFSKNFPDNSNAKFEKTDAKFRCRKTCGAEDLSFDQFFIGNCCVDASRSIGKCNCTAETKAETAAKKVVTCRKALEDAEKEKQEANDELNDKKKRRKIIQKRALFLGSAAMKEDNSELESEEEGENKKNNSGERNVTNTEGETCKVCFEIYAEGDRQKSAIIPCGHQACLGCLSSLPQKSCPTCRADFTDDKILKLFP